MMMTRIAIPAPMRMRIFMSFLQAGNATELVESEVTEVCGSIAELGQRTTTDTREQDESATNQNTRLITIWLSVGYHLFPDPVCSPPETLCRDCQVIRLILQRIQPLPTLGNLGNVLAHNTNLKPQPNNLSPGALGPTHSSVGRQARIGTYRVVDLSLDGSSLAVASCGSTGRVTRGIATGNVRVVRLRV